MTTRRLLVVMGLVATVGAGAELAAQQAMPRLAGEVLDVAAPSARVQGDPGTMRLLDRPCRTVPLDEARRRIVDVAVQEWAFFGFSIVDELDPSSWTRRPPVTNAATPRPPAAVGAFRPPGARAEEAARVASSIAGYWSVTPHGTWIVDRQNEAWTLAASPGVRWVEPWSAAFISWVMCEAGLGEQNRFQRAVAHHVYIDQAIRARDGRAPQAAFEAYDPGERAVTPGDLLCTAQRPMYRTLAERRRQMGEGARTHCDVVVTVDEAGGRLLAIGGNVRGNVSLKVLPATRQAGGPLRPMDRSMIEGARTVFAHLVLRAGPIEADALASSATIQAVPCSVSTRAAAGPDARLVTAGVITSRC